MVLAISLIKVVSDQEKVVCNALKNVEGIKNLYHNIGDRDLFLVLEAGNMDSVTRILDHIKKACPSGAVKMIGCQRLDPAQSIAYVCQNTA